MTVDWKKKLIPNLPYLLFVYLFDKLCQAVRLAPGLDASEKFLHLSQGFTEAFSSGLPSQRIRLEQAPQVIHGGEYSQPICFRPMLAKLRKRLNRLLLRLFARVLPPSEAQMGRSIG